MKVCTMFILFLSVVSIILASFICGVLSNFQTKKVETEPLSQKSLATLGRLGSLLRLNSQYVNKNHFEASSRQYGFEGYDDDPNWMYSHSYVTTLYDYFSVIGIVSLLGLFGTVLYVHLQNRNGSRSLEHEPWTSFPNSYHDLNAHSNKLDGYNWSQAISAFHE